MHAMAADLPFLVNFKFIFSGGSVGRFHVKADIAHYHSLHMHS